MVVTNFSPIIGGAEIQARLLAKYLVSNGIKVLVLTRRHRNWKKNQVIENFYVHRRRGIPFLGVISELSTAFVFCFFLLKKRKKYDIVHLHQATLLTAISGFFSKKVLKKKVICKIANSGNKFDLFTLKHRYKYLGPILVNILIENVDIFICLNKKIYNQFSELNIANTIIIPNGVEVSNKLKNDHYFCSPRRIVSTSRLTPQKNIEALLTAFSKLILINDKITLCIYGDGPLKLDLIDLSVKLKIPKHKIVFYGNKDNIRDIFQYGDIFVLPSFVEGMSNSLLEAMSIGIPSVVSNIPENLEVVTDSFNSLVFNLNDKYDLYNKLILLLNTNELYKSLSFNAIKSVERKYDINNISNYYINLYNQLLLK